MRTVELIKGISSSVLGFGCAPILGSVDAKSAKRALEFAFDNGVNHLDLARSYGFGEAEKFIGEFVKGKRQEVVIASKFGIKPNWKASLLKSVKPIVRTLRGKPKKNKDERQTATVAPTKNMSDYFLDRILPLRGKDMRNSLEKSLKELNTDYLDYFFIHEPHSTLPYIQELLEMADKLKTEGKIRAFGLAYMQAQRQLHETYINSFDLLQFNCSPGITDYDKFVLNRGIEPNIIFSPLRGGSNIIKPVDKLKKLLNDFPKSVVLCSMFNPEHLKQNISGVN